MTMRRPTSSSRLAFPVTQLGQPGRRLGLDEAPGRVVRRVPRDLGVRRERDRRVARRARPVAGRSSSGLPRPAASGPGSTASSCTCATPSTSSTCTNPTGGRPATKTASDSRSSSTGNGMSGRSCRRPGTRDSARLSISGSREILRLGRAHLGRRLGAEERGQPLRVARRHDDIVTVTEFQGQPGRRAAALTRRRPEHGQRIGVAAARRRRCLARRGSSPTHNSSSVTRSTAKRAA